MAMPYVAQAKITINGTNLETAIADAIINLEVELTTNAPGMFIIRFMDEKGDLANDTSKFDLGKEVEIFLPGTESEHTSPSTSVIKGEITAVEPEFLSNTTGVLVIRGYDKLHRLNRGAKIKAFLNMTDADIASQVVSTAGLTASVSLAGNSQQHNFLIQDSQTDLQFLQERARLIGAEILYESGQVVFRKRNPQASGVTLEWGVNMTSFTPRISLARQVDKVTVKSWDIQQKQKIMGVKTSATEGTTQSGIQFGGGVAQSKIAAAESFEVRQPGMTQAQAEVLAQEILNEINNDYITAEGVAFGDARLKPGKKVTINQVGARFNGEYVMNTVRHTYDGENGYMTMFYAGGKHRTSLLDLMDGDNDLHRQTWPGVYPAIVTNIKDENNWGRVKVKFPWLDDTLESYWARVIMPGVGAGHGMQWMPEVNDEVMVAFEHGNFNHPYVLGGVTNGTDAAIDPSFHKDGSNNEVRTMKTRTGHVLRFTDKSGEEKIEIMDGQSKVKIIMDAANQMITIESQKDITIKATGNADIKTTGNTKIEATGNLDIKSTGPMKIEGSATVDVKGTGPVNVQSTAILGLKGSMVQIG